MLTPTLLITADAILPMDDPRNALLHPAGIAVHNHRIADIAPRDLLLQKYPNVPHRHIAGVMMPGFINAHTHLELGYQPRAEGRPSHFTDWVTALMRQYPPADALDAAVSTAVRRGIADSLRHGVTAIGDISRHCALTRRLLAASPIRAVSFGEVIGLGKMRERCAGYLAAAADNSFATERLAVGLSPHAPYTIEGPALQRVVDRARAQRLPITMHVAELSDERNFLRDRTGALAEWSVMKNLVDDQIPSCDSGPLHWAAKWGLLGPGGAGHHGPVLLAHVNYCDEAELALLAASNVSVVYCPRTRDYFGHQPGHPYRAMLAAGINVCLGTDSLASNPDLSVLREAALLCERDGLSPYAAMEMMTWRAGKALGIDAGRLEAGRLADVIVMPADMGGSLDEVLGGMVREAREPVAVYVGGTGFGVMRVHWPAAARGGGRRAWMRRLEKAGEKGGFLL